MSASAVGRGPGSRSAMGMPSHFWLPMRSPPTGLDTHASVTQASTRSPSSSSSQVSVTSSSTMPCTRRLQVARVDLRDHEGGVDPVELVRRASARARRRRRRRRRPRARAPPSWWRAGSGPPPAPTALRGHPRRWPGRAAPRPRRALPPRPWPAGTRAAGHPRTGPTAVLRAGDGPAPAGSAGPRSRRPRRAPRRASPRPVDPSPPAPRPRPAPRRAWRPTPSAGRRAPRPARRARAGPRTSPIPRTTLSAVPNVEAAKSLSHGRGRVDERGPDGHQRVGARPGDQRDERPDAERHGARGESRERGEPGVPTSCHLLRALLDERSAPTLP